MNIIGEGINKVFWWSYPAPAEVVEKRPLTFRGKFRPQEIQYRKLYSMKMKWYHSSLLYTNFLQV